MKTYSVRVTVWKPIDVEMEVTCINAVEAKAIALSNAHNLTPRDDVKVIQVRENIRPHKNTLNRLLRKR